MKKNKSRVCGYALGGLLCAALLLSAACSRGRGENCAGSEAYGDVVLAEGVDLCSTASSSEKESIRALLDSREAAGEVAEITVDYPHDASVFPPDFAAPTFLWHDPSDAADHWLVELEFEEGGGRLQALVPGDPPPRGEIDTQCITITNKVYEPTPYQASARSWKPGPELWAAIKAESVDRPARVSFFGYRGDAPGRIVSRGGMTFRTSPHPVGAPIFYRDVPLMPSATEEGVIKPLDKNAQPLIGWRLRDISRADSRLLLKDMPTCANCHSFSADGGTLGMDIDGPDGDKGAYAVAAVQRKVSIEDSEVITWNAFEEKPRGHHTLGFLSRVSPDGRHVVSTVNEALYVRNFWDHKFMQVFFPTRGILAYYSTETGKIKALSGADDPEYVHCDAVWTPDGETLVFARAEARDPYERGRPLAEYAGDPNETQIQYDLYRMPFNDGRGGTPVPIDGASGNGMSNSFPKVSPDGKWVVFVKSKNGQLMRPDGRLWIVPLEGGEAREMRCNTDLMNSWHSFSPNGRWMVFSSKVNTPYTQMFLTHIDEDGSDSPPILIENSTAANRAVNIPEFVNVPFDEFESITVPAVHHYEYVNRGIELAQAGRHLEAIAEFERALEGQKREWRINDWRIHDSLSKSLLQAGRLDEALQHARESLKINPYNVEMHGNVGYLLSLKGDQEKALEHLNIALKLYPQDAKAWYNRGTVRLRMGDNDGAVEDYDAAIRRDPDYADAFNGRGTARRAKGDLDGAIDDFSEAIRIEPDNPTPWYFRARIKAGEGDLAGAVSDAGKALEVAPPGSSHRAEIQALYDQLRASL